MLDTLRKLLLMECSKELTGLSEEKKQMLVTKEELEKKHRDYESHMRNQSADSRVVEFKNNYSKISKFFNKKKYNAELKALGDVIHEEYSSKIDEILKELSRINTRKIEVERELALHTARAQEVDAARTFSELNITFEEAKELLSKNGINIFDYSVNELLSLGANKETTRSVDFMKRAVDIDPYNIIFDQTLDFGMYYELIKNLGYVITIENENSKREIETFNELKKYILNMLERSMSGLTHIKPLYLLEVIRFYFRDTVMHENGIIEEGKKNEHIKDVISHISRVIDMALQLSIEDYVELESMYHPEENDYYCHQTGVPGVEDAIFREGLKVSLQGTYEAECLIVKNARKIDCFLAIAGYINFYGGNGFGQSRIILEIPKGTERPIGGDSINGMTYVLPEYAIASLYQEPVFGPDDGVIEVKRPVLHINNQNKKKYRYLFKDGYNPKNPCPIENPEFEMENVEGIKR